MQAHVVVLLLCVALRVALPVQVVVRRVIDIRTHVLAGRRGVPGRAFWRMTQPPFADLTGLCVKAVCPLDEYLLSRDATGVRPCQLSLHSLVGRR